MTTKNSDKEQLMAKKKTARKGAKKRVTNWWVYRHGTASASWYYSIRRAYLTAGFDKRCPNNTVGYSTFQAAADAMVYMQNNSGNCPP
jgi:hypothetical protein